MDATGRDTVEGRAASGPSRRRAPRPRDVAIAAVATVLDVAVFSTVVAVPPGTAVLIVVYAVLGNAAVAWRSVAPVAVFAIMWVHATAAFVIVPEYGPFIGLLVALFTVGSRTRVRTGVVALATMIVPSVLQMVREVAGTPETPPWRVVLVGSLVLTTIDVAVWAAGRWTLLQHERTALLVLQREHAARDAITRERVRIARDLHDIISHSVSVMSLQAAGAQALLRDRPDRAGQALTDIRASGAHAMVELRRLLVLLRAEDDRGPVPAPEGPGGVADLDELLAGVRAAGVPARLRTHGQPRDLDPGAGLTVYRVVQEALTNVARHAGVGVDTEVDITWRDTDVVVDVRNAAPVDRPAAGGTPGGGRGLIGMRERVSSVGGSLRSGPGPDGGFRVSATIPIMSGAAPPDPCTPTPGDAQR